MTSAPKANNALRDINIPKNQVGGVQASSTNLDIGYLESAITGQMVVGGCAAEAEKSKPDRGRKRRHLYRRREGGIAH